MREIVYVSYEISYKKCSEKFPKCLGSKKIPQSSGQISRKISLQQNQEKFTNELLQGRKEKNHKTSKEFLVATEPQNAWKTQGPKNILARTKARKSNENKENKHRGGPKKGLRFRALSGKMLAFKKRTAHVLLRFF